MPDPASFRRPVCDRHALRFAGLLLALSVTCSTATASADDLDDFAFALNAYVNSDFGSAVARLRPLVGSEPVPLRRDLVTAARRYYAASLALTNQEAEARRVLRQMLRDDPDAQFDAIQFSPLVLRLFEEIRESMAVELTRIRADRAAQRRAHEVHLADQRLALQLITTREVRVVRVSRGLMYAPFGVGQYANGRVALGAMFTTIETLALGATVLAAVALIDVGLPDNFMTQCHISTCGPLIGTFWGGLGIFALSSVAGVIEANASYRGDHVETRPRTPPPELRDIHLTFAPLPVGHGVVAAVSLRF